MERIAHAWLYGRNGMRKHFVTASLIAVAAGMTGITANSAAAQASSDAVEVPLEMLGNRLIVPVESADGAHLRFALTTGAGVTVFSESTAAQLPESPELTLGGLPVPMEGRATIPDEQLTVDGVTVDGLISPNMLSDFNVLIDVPNERLVLKPFGRSVQWEGMNMSDPVSVRVFHGTVLSLDVVLNGRAYPGTLDLGTTTLVVNESVQKELGLTAQDVGALALGSSTLSDLPVHTIDLAVFDRWSPNGDGFVIVGAALAKDCAISISWVHSEVRTCVQ
jgi:hypothetical protein